MKLCYIKTLAERIGTNFEGGCGWTAQKNDYEMDDSDNGWIISHTWMKVMGNDQLLFFCFSLMN